MKKKLLFTSLSLIGITALGQTNTFPSTGNVGIGTTSPQGSLEIASSTRAEILMRDNGITTPFTSLFLSGTGGRVFQAYNDKGGVSMQGFTNNASSIGASIQGFVGSTAPTAAAVQIQGYKLSGTTSTAMTGTEKVLQIAAGTSVLVTYLANGNVGIGTAAPNEKLSIKGKIRAQEIKVETANWPDYVFAKEYKLPTLKETEERIKETGHLPGIPSAEEVKTNGVELGEMNVKLLQKIEELTLHLIEMKKELDSLKRN